MFNSYFCTMQPGCFFSFSFYFCIFVAIFYLFFFSCLQFSVMPKKFSFSQTLCPRYLGNRGGKTQERRGFVLFFCITFPLIFKLSTSEFHPKFNLVFPQFGSESKNSESKMFHVLVFLKILFRFHRIFERKTNSQSSRIYC